MKKFLKKENGITGIDVTISIVIFIMGAAIIFNLYQKLYEVSVEYKANEVIIGYLTEICEEIDYEDYDNITKDRVNTIIKLADIPSQYNITYTIKNYKDENTKAEDDVKKVIMKVEYKIGTQNRNFIFSKTKVRE